MKRASTRTTSSLAGPGTMDAAVNNHVKTSRGSCRKRRSWEAAAVFAVLVGLWVPAPAQAGCGHVGERACCFLEKDFGACRGDLIQVGDCGNLLGSGNCHCNDNPNNCCDADGVCVTDTDCGGDLERACCFFERPLDPCDDGLVEFGNCNNLIGVENCGGCSIGVCASFEPCGHDGERACCALESFFSSCVDGLIEDLAMDCVTDRSVQECICEFGGTSLGICRNKRGVGENCDPTFDPCEDGLVCRAVAVFESKCFADLEDAVSNEQCLSFFDRDVLDDAVAATPLNGDLGETMSFGFGSAGGLIAQSSNVRGVVYGRDGCYGCYHTQCEGWEFSVGFSGVIEVGRSTEHLLCPGPTVCDNDRGTVCADDSDCTGGSFCAAFACTNNPTQACTMDSNCPGSGTCRRCNTFDGESFIQIISVGTPLEFVGVSETISFANCGNIFDESTTCEQVGTGESIAIGFTLSPPINVGVADCTTIMSVVGCLDSNGDFVEISNQSPTCNAGGPYSIECNGQTNSTHAISASASDSDGDSLTFSWATTCSGGSFSSSTIEDPTLSLPSSCSTTCGVTLTVDDGLATSTCSATVSLGDSTSPTAACAAASVALDSAGSGSIVPADVNNGSSDACGAVILALDKTAFTCVNVGGNAVALTVTDECGNSSKCNATVTVQDNINPVALCQDVIVVLDASGNGSIVPQDVDNGSSDACGVSLSLDTTAFGCADVGLNTVTLTVTDVNGNSSTCDATITVNDNINPVALCQDVIVVLDATGNGSIVEADVDSGSNDACGVDILSLDTTAFGCADVGSNTVTLTVTDVNGNSSTCDATITIEDNEDPVITCPSDIFVESAAGQCKIVVNYDVGVSDNCPGRTFVCTHPSGSLFPVGTTAVTCTATDASGNQSDCSFSVTVNDPPHIVSVTPATQTVQYSDKIVPVVVTATDCGPGSVLTLEFNSGDVPSDLALSSTADSCVTNGASLIECKWTLSNNIQVLKPEGDYVIDGIKAVDPVRLDGVTLKSSPAKTITIQVKAENATIVFDGGNPVAVQVASDGGNSGMFDMIVDVEELLPDWATVGGNLPGDIGLAVMSMTLAPIGPGGGAVGTCTPDNDPNPLDYSSVLTVTCEFDNVGVNTYTVQAVLVANGPGDLFYVGSNEDVLVVFDPSLGFTTGGGHFAWPGTGDRTNWGYTMKYNRRRTKIQGSLLLIRHLPDGTKYRIKSNKLFGLAIGDGINIGAFGWASFAGKCTYLDPSLVDPIGNHEFVTYVEDHNEPGAGFDKLWLQVFDMGGDLIGDMSMDETAVSNAETIVGGNIVVPH